MKANASSTTLMARQHQPNVLPLKGEIDLHVSPAVTESLNAMTEKEPERIVIDLSRATYIDSAGLAGTSSRKTANACDTNASEMSADTTAHFIFVARNNFTEIPTFGSVGNLFF